MRSASATTARKVILVLSDGKDTGPLSFRQRPVSQAEAIDRARRERRDDLRGRHAQPRRTRPCRRASDPGGLQAMLLADMPDPGLARVAEETGGGYTEIRFGQDLGVGLRGGRRRTAHASTCSPSRRRSATARCTTSTCSVTRRGLKPRARKSYVAPKE